MKDQDFRYRVLNNEERVYFALNPIENHWDEVIIKDNFVVYYDGNVIKKTIEVGTSGNDFSYFENDADLCTRERKILLPRTAKGKEKNITYTSVTAPKPTGCCFVLRLKGSSNYSTVHVYNPRNEKFLPIRGDRELHTLEDFKHWLKNYIATCPVNYSEKLDSLKNTPHQTVKYFNGDIFRFEIDREHYGFGLITGQIAKIRKDKLLWEEHALNNVMCVPLIVRFYVFKTKNKQPSIEEITSYPLSPADIISDGNFIWGAYEIIGNKSLQESDIDFPIHAGLSQNKYYCFFWGIGHIALKKPEMLRDRLTYMNNGVSFNIDIERVEALIEKGECLAHTNDLRHPENAELLRRILSAFGLSPDITFDEFNAAHNGMTRRQYADYASKYLRKQK